MKQGKLQKALADYTSALKIYDDYTEAHYQRAVILNKLGKDRGALYDLNKAIKIDPNFKDAYTLRTRIHTELKQHRLIGNQ
jgi:tetratricopeptide (TPR) repeat protein